METRNRYGNIIIQRQPTTLEQRKFSLDSVNVGPLLPKDTRRALAAKTRMTSIDSVDYSYGKGSDLHQWAGAVKDLDFDDYDEYHGQQLLHNMNEGSLSAKALHNGTNSISKKSKTKDWNVKSSFMAKHTLNPIRKIVDGMKLTPNPEKAMIALSIGDPTIFGNLGPAKEAQEAVVDALMSRKYDGYAPSVGYLAAREAVAKYAGRPEAPLSPADVILTSGASHALELCLTVLGDRGRNILIPYPGFSIYKTICASLAIDTRSYRLRPEMDWEVDLKHLASLIDDNTAAIVLNNPNNPCGSVYSKEHLLEILFIADRYKVPIIADEIYDDVVFPGHTFFPVATLTETVPVLACNGLTKKFIVPGWRMGWITIHDRNGLFAQEITPGLVSLSQRILGPNTVVQGALPKILSSIPQDYFQNTIDVIHKNAVLAYEMLLKMPGMSPVMPAGALYMMTGISMEFYPEFRDELAFTSELVSEQSVFCLPGQCFDYPNYFRIVLSVPYEKMKEALERIAGFCEKHYVPRTNVNVNDIHVVRNSKAAHLQR